MATKAPIRFFQIKEPSFQGVSEGNLATMELPRGFTYYKLALICYKADGTKIAAADVGTQLGTVTVKANGRAFIDNVPASVLLARSGYYSDVNSQAGIHQDGILQLNFAADSLVSLPERSVYAIGTANLSSFTIEVKIAGSEIARIDAISYKSSEIREFGSHIAIRSFNRSFSGTGEYDESKLPDSTLGSAYRALFISEGSGTIDNVICWRDNTRIFEEVPKELNDLRQLEMRRTPQDGFYIVDFGVNNTLGSLVPLPLADWRQRIYFSGDDAPEQFAIYAELVEGMSSTVAVTA